TPFPGEPLRPAWVLLQNSARKAILFLKRRGWDSNPRALADKRCSRPPRYDHFDTSPRLWFSSLLSATCDIVSHKHFSVNNYFPIFSIFAPLFAIIPAIHPDAAKKPSQSPDPPAS